MDTLRLASGMGMGMGMDVVSGALQSARDSASATVAAGSAAAAAGITSSVDSLKNTSMADVSSGVLSATSTLKDSATAGLNTAAKTAMATSDVLASSAAATINDPRATLSSVSTMGASIGASAWAGTCGAGSAGGLPGRGARSADEEDSQSGGEEGGGKQAPSAWMGVASRLGLGSRAEKEQLVPKEELELEEGRCHSKYRRAGAIVSTGGRRSSCEPMQQGLHPCVLEAAPLRTRGCTLRISGGGASARCLRASAHSAAMYLVHWAAQWVSSRSPRRRRRAAPGCAAAAPC